MAITVEDLQRWDKDISDKKNADIAKEVERRKNPVYRFATRAGSSALKLFNTPGDIYSAVTGKEVEDVVPQYQYQPAETGAQKFADITGTLAGEIGESALLGAMLAPLGIGSKVASGTTKLLKGGKAAQVVGKMAGSAVENIAEDLISDTARGIADKKSAGEIAKDFGTSVLFDTVAAGVLEGIPAVVRGVKNSRTASKAASAASEAAEDAGQTIQDSRRIWSEIGGVTDDVADTAADAVRAQQRVAAAGAATSATDAIPGRNAAEAAQNAAAGGADSVRRVPVTPEATAVDEALPNPAAGGRIEAQGGDSYGGQVRQTGELGGDGGTVYRGSAGGSRGDTSDRGRTEGSPRKYAETQESFERRTAEVEARSGGTAEGKGYILDQHGNSRIAYRTPDTVDPASEAVIRRQAEDIYRVAAPKQEELNRLMQAISDELHLQGTEGAQKSVDSILDKVRRKSMAGSPYSVYDMKDHVRGALLVNDYNEIPAVLQKLDENSIPYTVENFFEHPTEWGYKGVHITFPYGDGINAEIQIATPEAWQVKKISDQLYEKWRNAPTEMILSPEYQKDLETSRQLWDRVREPETIRTGLISSQRDNGVTLPDAISAGTSSSFTGNPSIKSPNVMNDGSASQTMPSYKASGSLPDRTGRWSTSQPSSVITKSDIPAPLSNSSVAQNPAGVKGIADVVAEVGDQRAFRNAYNAIESGDIPLNQAVTVGGRNTTVGEVVDAVEARLPDDADYLDRFIRDTDRQSRMLKIDLQKFAAKPGEELDEAAQLALQKYAAERKLEWLKLAPGEDGTKVRGYLQNRLKGEDITSTPELVEVLSGRVDKYTPKADTELLENARRLIDGDEARNSLYNRFMNADSNTLFTDEEVAAAELMASDFIRDGALDEWADLVTGISRSGTAAGRSLRAYSLMQMLTPEGTLKYAQRLMNNAADERFYKGFSEELDNFLSGLAKKLQSVDGSIDPDGLTKIVNQHISSLSPDSRLKNILKRKNTAVAQRIVEASQEGLLNAGNMRRALSDVLDVPNLDEDTISRLVDLVNQAKNVADGGVEQAELFEEIYRTLAAKMPVSMMDKLNTWRKIGMLSNPKTHFKNFVSNIAVMPQRKATDAVTQLLERFVDPSQRTRALGWSTSDFGKQIRNTVDAQTDRAMLELSRVGKYDLSENVIKKYRQIFKNKPLESYQKFVSDALQWEDDIFKRTAYRDALGQAMTARRVTEVTPELHQLAMDRALEATFQRKNAIDDVIQSLKKKKGFGKIVDFIVPFSKTPSNLMIQAFEYSPAGLVKSGVDLVQNLRGAKSAKNMAEILNEAAKGIVGTAEMLGIGFLLGSSGMLKTGYSSSDKDRAMEEMQGKQQYGLHFGDWSISVDWLQPVAFPIIAGAAIGEAYSKRDEDEGFGLTDIVTNGMDSIFNLSMLQSFTNFLGGGNQSTTQNIMDNMSGWLTQYIPSIVSAGGRVVDPVQRKPGDDLIANIQNRLGLGGGGLGLDPVMPELNIWGETVYRTGEDAGFLGNVLQQFVSPSNVKTAMDTDDPMTRAFMELYETADVDQKTRREMVPKTVTESWKLPDGTLVQDSDVYEQAMRDVGQLQKQAAEDFIIDGDKVQITVGTGRTNAKGEEIKRKKWVSWDTATDEEKIKALGKIFSDVSKEVKDAYEDDTVDRLWEGVLKYG